MAQTPITYNNFVNGLTTDLPEINVVPPSLYAMSNVNVSYKKGAILKRCGYEKVANTLEADKAITGLFDFRQENGTEKMLATVNDSTDSDTQLFFRANGAGNWTEIAAAETAWAGKPNVNVEMESFIGYCFFVGWGSTSLFLPVASLTGTTFSTTTNVTDMPQAKYIKRYRDRLYIANCFYSATNYPYRVYFSSVPSAGAITWDPAEDFFDVDYSEEITGMEQNWDRLVLFTNYSAYFYDGIGIKKTWDIGCSNHRTIKNQGQYMIWANYDGIWVSTGGFPQNISERVVDFIRGANMDNAFATLVDEEYHLHVGNVTVNGLSYSNCVIIWNIATNSFRIHEYADNINIMARYFEDGKNFVYLGGADDGNVYRLGKYTDSTLLTSDNRKVIESFFRTGALHWDMPYNRKQIGKIIAYAEKAMGVELKWRTITSNNEVVDDWSSSMKLTKFHNISQVNPQHGFFLQLEGTEIGSNEYWEFYGFTVLLSLDTKIKN